VISRLDVQSQKERSGKTKVAHGQEMFAITADTGLFFSILLKAIRARRVLEVGTSAGFSTLWLAGAIDKKDKVITIEMDPRKVERARKNFKEAGVDRMIDIRQGVALDVLHALKGKFDFVLLDADKEKIIEYFDLVLPLVRTGAKTRQNKCLFPSSTSP